jgi:4-diphosphocytidyl-2-C-methyl-D-erythritol kinase
MKSMTLTIKAHAKLNIYLDIVGKRADGYHNIVTEMQEISLHDTVTVTRLSENPRLFGSPKISVTCSDPRIPTDERNIAYRAAEAFIEFSGMTGLDGAEIHIEKRIPVMAGLGGSSTNGAAVLRAMNSLSGVFSEGALHRIGADLGADVPFHLVGGRAKCEGIGDIITPLPDLPPQWYVIIQPDFVCDTKSAYALYNSEIKQNHRNVFMDLYNDERLNRICDDLSATLTGSGSAVFMTFDNETSAKSAFEKLDFPFKTIATNIRRI